MYLPFTNDMSKYSSSSNRNYKGGTWGHGSMNAGQLASKYGLDTSSPGRGDGHIWGTRPDGSRAYLGKVNDGLKSNKDLIAAHSRQAHPGEGNHAQRGESLDSSGDVVGAILNLWRGENIAKPKPAPVAVAASSDAPSKPYNNIPGVDSYVPRRYQRPNMEDNNQSSKDNSYDPTSVFNYGYGNDKGYYPDGNEQGLKDREGTIEKPGAASDFLANWIFNYEPEKESNPSTRVGNVAKADVRYNDNDRSPYDRYSPERYY